MSELDALTRLVQERGQRLESGVVELCDAIQALVEHLRQAQPRVYGAPVGLESQRGQIWPGSWVDATGYCVWYFDQWWHTGADLNLNHPRWDADAHSPVYAIADGEVYAARQFDGWGNVLCIRHDECLSRYAHVESVQVRQGQAVTLGQHVANIGNAGGRYPYHLHFDIVNLDARMAQYPGDWPGADKLRVLSDYLDPKKFLGARV